MKPNKKTDPCDTGMLLDLAAGKLVKSDAEKVKNHVQACPACRRELELWGMIHGGVEEMKAVAPGDGVSMAAWSAVEGEAAKAAGRARTRNAWRTLAASRRARAAAGALAAALAVVTAAALYFLLDEGRPGPGVVTRDQTLHAGVDRSLSAVFPCGAAIELTPGSKAEVVEAGPGSGTLRLDKGSVAVAVNRLDEGGRFEVHTDDAVVIVKGTRFTVTRQRPGFTSVSVSEGKVLVRPAGKGRQDIVLSAGQAADVPGQKAYLDGLKKEGLRAMDRGAEKKAASLFEQYLLSYPGYDPDVSLLLAGLKAKKGDHEQAMGLFGKVAESGNSLRAQNAIAYMAMLHKKLGRNEESLKTWDAYLQRFPGGVHAAEALHELAAAECEAEVRPHIALLEEKYPGLESTRELLMKCDSDGK